MTLTKPKQWVVTFGPAVVVLVLGLLMFQKLRGFQDSARASGHTREVIEALDATIAAVLEAESAQRAFLITGEERYLAPYEGAVREAMRALDRAVQLEAAEPAQLRRLSEARILVELRFSVLEAHADIRRTQGADAARSAVLAGPGEDAMSRLRHVVDEVRTVEREVLLVRQAAEARQARMLSLIIVAGTLVTLAASLLLNSILARFAAGQQRARREIEEKNALLEQQSHDLQAQAEELEAQAEELEAQAEELEQQALQLEETAAALEEANEEKNALLESTDQGFFSLDPAGRGVLINRAASRLLGYSPEEFIGRDVHQLIHGRLPDGTVCGVDRCPIHETLAGGEGRRVDGEVFWRADGTPLPVEYSAFPLRGDGRTRGVVVAFSDTSARRRADEERMALLASERQAREEAELANRAKAEFLRTVSHELRTPLNAIAGYVDLMDLGIRGPVTEGQREDLERIKRNQQLLLSLINDILNFARLEAGKVEYDLCDMPLDSILAGMEVLIQPQVQAKGLRYEYDPADPSLAVRADREKLEQILLNLITNAIKFTDAGGRIQVCCAREGDRVAIRVADTGCGIPSDKLERIFDPFVQVDRSRTRTAQQGVGLGLSISRDLARGMGGDLVAESRVGVGSTFTLLLPAAGGSADRPQARPDHTVAAARG